MSWYKVILAETYTLFLAKRITEKLGLTRRDSWSHANGSTIRVVYDNEEFEVRISNGDTHPSGGVGGKALKLLQEISHSSLFNKTRQSGSGYVVTYSPTDDVEAIKSGHFSPNTVATRSDYTITVYPLKQGPAYQDFASEDERKMQEATSRESKSPGSFPERI